MKSGRIEAAILALIVLLAIGLRFGWPGTRPFAFDEAYVSRAALQMDHGGGLATIGMPSSAGVPNLPGAVWIFATPYALSTDPLVASAFVGILSLITIGVTWIIVRRAWGTLPALAAALFLAANPYSVLYARSIWAQNLLPLFGVLWLFAAVQAWTTDQRHRLWICLTVIIAGAAIIVHFAGITLALATLYVAVRARWWQRSTIGGVLIGIGTLAIGLLPTIIRVSQQPTILAQFRSALGGVTAIDLNAPLQLINVATGRAWNFLLLGNDNAIGVGWLPGIFILLILLIGVINVSLSRASPTAQDFSAESTEILLSCVQSTRTLELCAITLLASVIWLIAHKTPPLPHYQLTALPALAVLIGAALASLPRRGWRIGALLVVIACAAVWTAQIGLSLAQAGQAETPGGLGTPLGTVQAVATAAPLDRPVLLFTHGDDPALDGEPAVFAALWWTRGDAARIVNGETTLLLPSVPATLIATQAAFQAWEELRDDGLLTATQALPRRSGAPPFMMTTYNGQSTPNSFTMIPPVSLADGLTLIGWRARAVGLRLRISTLWHVRSTPISALQQFNHLRTADTLTDQPFRVSDVPISIRSMRAGDTAIIMADFYPADFPSVLSSTPTPFWIDLGHYTLSDLKRIPLSDGSGDHIRLGPFRWPLPPVAG